VMVVIHADKPFGCISFIQGAGWAGRGGEDVRSTRYPGQQAFDLLRILVADWTMISTMEKATIDCCTGRRLIVVCITISIFPHSGHASKSSHQQFRHGLPGPR